MSLLDANVAQEMASGSSNHPADLAAAEANLYGFPTANSPAICKNSRRRPTRPARLAGPPRSARYQQYSTSPSPVIERTPVLVRPRVPHLASSIWAPSGSAVSVQVAASGIATVTV